MKKTISGILLGILILLVVVVPVLAAYYAYITVTEASGNPYEQTPFMYSRNFTWLISHGYITSSGLDTRVATGDGDPLPHMLANDRLMFVSDLEAYEARKLLFVTGQTALSSFPVIVGYDGYITTNDDDDLELTYVMELLVSGYFDASAGSDKNILYKEEAYRVYISAANTLRVAALEVGGGEQWSLSYNGFTSGLHTIYVMANGLVAFLYVDDFVVAKDTENLYESSISQLSNTKFYELYPISSHTFYAEGRYWAFYTKDVSPTEIYYRTSTDGSSWAAEQAVGIVGGDDVYRDWGVWLRGDYFHITYADSVVVRYRRGEPQADGSIVWSAAWQTAYTPGSGVVAGPGVAVDTAGYPFIVYRAVPSTTTKTYVIKSSANDGTWSTAGGYPLELGDSSSCNHWASVTAYPNSNKIYALRHDEQTYSYMKVLKGWYYNGSTWGGSAEIIDAGDGYTITNSFNAVADEDDNVYIVWSRSTGGTFLRIRYADGSFSDTISIAATGYQPCVSYNTGNGYIYITYRVGTSIKVIALANGEFSDIGTVCSVSAAGMQSTTPYGSHIGIMYSSTSDDTKHAYIQFPWDWNENINNWTWMQNNVMSYADYILLGIDGELVLEYQPETIIQGTTLPDEEGGDHPGAITWGDNPAGVTITMSSLIPMDGGGTVPYVPASEPGLVPGSQDMAGPTGQPGWTDDILSLTTHPFYPAVKVASDLTGIPVRLVWILGATFLLVLAMIVCFRYVPHQIITILVGGGMAAFFYSMGIYPFWVMFIFAVGGLAIILGERFPSVG